MRGLKPILIIDDDYAEQVILKRAFEDLKITNPIVYLTNCEEAIAYLKGEDNKKPSIILMDLNGPGIDGFEFLRVIKTDVVLKQIPVIVLSGSCNEEDMFESFRLGVAG